MHARYSVLGGNGGGGNDRSSRPPNLKMKLHVVDVMQLIHTRGMNEVSPNDVFFQEFFKHPTASPRSGRSYL